MVALSESVTKNRLKRNLVEDLRWPHIRLAIKPRYLGNHASQIKIQLEHGGIVHFKPALASSSLLSHSSDPVNTMRRYGHAQRGRWSHFGEFRLSPYSILRLPKFSVPLTTVPVMVSDLMYAALKLIQRWLFYCPRRYGGKLVGGWTWALQWLRPKPNRQKVHT